MATKKQSISFDDVLNRETRGFTSMVKPVGSLCNMRCKYCYYLDKKSLYGGREPFMNDNLLEKYVQNTIEGNNAPVIYFVWHGGEPLLAGKEFFKKAVKYQAIYGKGRKIENSIQTNGLLIDREWCSFFKDNNFLVGISIDGPQSIHDMHRLDAEGRGTWSRVMNAINLMYQTGTQYNTLSTINVHSEAKADEVYLFLRQISTFMQFLPVSELILGETICSPDNLEAKKAPWSVSARGFGEFMCRIFDIWVTHDVGSRFVQLFDATLANHLQVPPSICSLCEVCGTGLTVEHNGDVYACDHFVYPNYKLGNIQQTPLCELAASKKQFEFGIMKRESLSQQCRRCKYYTLCYGECPKHRFIRNENDDYSLNSLCSGYKMFFEHSWPYMIYMKELLLKKKAPALVMDKARKEITL